MKPSNCGQGAIVKRPSQARGRTELGWLHSRHTFSFGDYFDPDQMGFCALRVINENIVEPGKGLGTLEHRDVEIITCVIEGEFEHKDSLGNVSLIRAGNFQSISAGAGITHSESNPSTSNRLHFLQLWLTPSADGGRPCYAERTLGKEARSNELKLLFCGQPREGALEIRQDAAIYRGKVGRGHSLAVTLAPAHHAWLQLISGQIHMLGQVLRHGDGVGISNTSSFEVVADDDSLFLLLDLA